MEDILKDAEELLTKNTLENELRVKRAGQARDFLSSEFVSAFLMPFVEKDRMTAYPNPNETGWEESYRIAYAKDTVYANLFATIQSWVQEGEQIVKKSKEVPKDIIDA